MTDSQVQVRMLGGFRVEVDDRALGPDDWPTRRAGELVQLLALSDRHALSREQAIEHLWPDLDATAGAANLRKAAHHARKALGDDDAVVLGAGRVRLFPGADVHTDLAAFEAKARAGLAAREPDRCARAADLWGGELLPGARYATWSQARRTHVQRLYHRVLAGAERFERLLEVDPTNEMATRRVMLARLEVGDRHGAIRTYGRLRTALARELGVAPGKQVETVYRHCVAGLRPARPTVVGRDHDLAEALAALDAARRGDLGLLAVRGPAGIGKSTLLQVLGDRAGQRGWLAPLVVATPAGEPHQALAALVDQLLATDPSLVDELTEPARSVLAAVSAMAGPADPPPDGMDRQRVAGAVRQLLAAIGDPVALVVDDAHAADDATIDVLAQVASADVGTTALVVLAARDTAEAGLLARAVRRLVRGRRGSTIDLGPIDPSDLATIVRTAGPDALDDEVVEQVVAMADGNPFFADALAQDLRSGDVTSDTWDAVVERMLDVESEAADHLARLALAGDQMTFDDVSAITGLDTAAATSLLDQAIDLGVLRVSRARYRFRHDLVREALVARMSPHRRVVAHREVARRLGEHAAPPARVAQHWLDGDEPDQAAPWLLAAGERAIEVGAYADARTHLERLLDHDPEHPRALRLHAEALDALGEPGAAVAHGAAAAASDPDLAPEIRARQAIAQLKAGDPAGALETLEDVEVTSVRGRVAVAATRCGAAMLGLGDAEHAAELAEEARRRAMEAGDAAAVTEASWARSLVAHGRRDMTGLLHSELLTSHEVPAFATHVFDGLLCATEGIVHGDLTGNRVVDFADELVDQARHLGAARGEAFGITVRGEARALADDRDAAVTDLETGARLHHEIGAPGGRALALQRHAEVALAEADHDDARDLLDRALAAARDSALGQHLHDRIHGTRIRVARTREEIARALDDGEDATRQRHETCMACRVTLAVPAAIGAAEIHDFDRARHHLEVAAFTVGVFWAGTGWEAALDEVRGHLARARDDDEQARSCFTRASRSFEALGHRRDARRCGDLVDGATPADA